MYIVKVYKDEDKAWRWVINSKRNGKIVGASSEGFKSLANVFNNLIIVTSINKGDFEKVGKEYTYLMRNV